MLFNSLEFLIFLPITFALYWLAKSNKTLQNLVIVIASCIFYAWLDWRFLFLIGFTGVSSYVTALVKNSNGGGKNWWIISNIIVNLLILGLFKYYNFFAESISGAFSAIGFNLDIPTLKLILPIGISFYTFKAISYSVDVYRGKMEAAKDFMAFMSYILFFPQLLAGPIEKAINLYPQFNAIRTFGYQQAVDGSKLIIWGLFKKLVIADCACNIVNSIYANIEGYNASALLICAFLYTFQIYGDFSGYSDMAIGIGKLFGIESKKNFNLPYLSRDIAEFWKRWHISLNSWFVDYVYIPLGGSRVSKYVTIRNTFIIFLLSGLWHGANWTFVVWGAYHALLFVPLLWFGLNKRFTAYQEGVSISAKEWLNILLTFVLAMIGWIIFRADNISDAWLYITKLCNVADYGIPNINPKRLFAICECMMAIVFVIFMEIRHKSDDIVLNFKSRYALLNWSGYIFVAVWAVLFYTVGQTFIYFQF